MFLESVDLGLTTDYPVVVHYHAVSTLLFRRKDSVSFLKVVQATHIPVPTVTAYRFLSLTTKAPKSTHITPILKSLHCLKVNERIESLSLTKFLYDRSTLLSSPYLSLTSSQYPLLILLSLFLTRQPSPCKSQIAHLAVHHFVFGINFQILSVSLTSLVSIHLLIHLSTHLYHQQILPTLDFFYLLDCLVIMGLDWIYHAHHFIFSFTF